MNNKVTESQLYTTLSDLSLPDSIQRFRDNTRINYQRLHATAFMRWPNGKPCMPVNMYLLDNAHKWTGDSATSYASELSEWVRYCAKHGKSFGDLNDYDIFALVDKLRTDVYLDDPHQRVRNDNTVRRIIQRGPGLPWLVPAISSSPPDAAYRRAQRGSGHCLRTQEESSQRSLLLASPLFAHRQQH